MTGEGRSTQRSANGRLAICLLIALGAAFKAYWYAATGPIASDFDQLGFAGRALLEGRNPYEEICPGCAFEWGYFYYPLTAVVAVLPLALLPQAVANAVFMAVSAGAFAWVLSRNGYGRVLVLLSVSMGYAVENVQWAPLYAASTGVPALAVFYAAKPSLALAFFAGWPRWHAVVGGLVLLGISLLWRPDWPADWLAALSHTTLTPDGGDGMPYLAPVQLLPTGPLVLLALLRWRRPEARLMAVLACIPQTLLMYESAALMLVPRTWRQAAVFVAGSWIAYALLRVGAPYASRMAWYVRSGELMIWFLYLPCLAMLLRRPNEGGVPAWLERRLAHPRVPAWLRGVATQSAG